MIKKCIIAIWIIYTNAILHAQILNIEKYRQDKDTAKALLWNINLGIDIRKQRTSTFNYNATINLVYLSDKHSYMSINNIDFVRTGNSEVASGHTHIRINFLRRKLFSYEPFYQLQFDRGRGLDRRELAGFSFRVNFHNRDKLNIGFNTGVMYEKENWRGNILRFFEEEDSSRAETTFIKNTTNLYLRANLNPHVSLFTITYYQARFNDFFNPRIVSDIQLVFKINRRFSFSNYFTSTVDTLPIAERNRYIYNFRSALIIKFE